MNRRVFITGVTGFVGGHLVRALSARGGVEIFGVSLSSSWSPAHKDVAGLVRLHQLDLCDQSALRFLLADVRPAWIFHLAGYADAGKSHQEPEAAWKGNLTATLRLYEAVKSWGGTPRILYVGSGMIYGDSVGRDGGIDEQTEFRPDSPYAASKAAADLLSYQYFRTSGLPIVRARPFNHAGPGQAPIYAVSSFARQAALIERGSQPPVIRAGNLDARRDFTDVRDVAAAYLLLIEKGIPGAAYNIASGRTVAIREVLQEIQRQCRVPVEFVSEAALQRKVETAPAPVRTAALTAATGWTPRFSLQQTIADTLEFWRQRLAEEQPA